MVSVILPSKNIGNTTSSGRLQRPISHSYTTSESVAKIAVDTTGTAAPTTQTGHALSPDASHAQDMAQRRELLGPGVSEKSPKATLTKALQHYEKTQNTTPIPTPKSLLEKIASRLIPQPDPNIQKFNDLHTLYATALPVCGESLRQVISEEDMQHTLETVWKTGKVDTSTFELFETATLSIVNNTLMQGA